MKAPIFGIDRLRMGTDGNGITTLVGFMGCRLRCKYCLNDICHEDPKTCRSVQWLTPEELYDKVKIDDLYFQATGGGICFGGGEPLIYSDFICEFKRICNPRWKITIETSGVGSWVDFEDLAPVVDQWFVDVKTLDPFTYENYTGNFLGYFNIYIVLNA